MGRFVLIVMGVGTISYMAFCLALWFGQTRLIFHPQLAPTTTPAEFGIAYEDVWIEMGQGRVHGWWLPAPTADTQTVLILSGNASNVEDGLSHAIHFLKLGLSALAIDYRGYGNSEGSFPTEAHVYEDAAAAWHYLTQIRQILPSNIVLFGHSIGGAVAVDLASQQPEAAGAIIQASFTSMGDMMDEVGYSRVVPKWLLNQRFASEEKAPKLQMPVLFIHGLSDRTIPASMSQQLYSLTPEPKQIWFVPGADHNDIADVAGQQYEQVLSQWLTTLSSQATSAKAIS